MITIDLIREGYNAGIVKVVDGYPLGGDGAVCQIGDGWFYFGGEMADAMTAEEYMEVVPAEDIVKEIYDTLDDFRNIGEEFEDEYCYYELYLNEILYKEVPCS